MNKKYLFHYYNINLNVILYWCTYLIILLVIPPWIGNYVIYIVLYYINIPNQYNFINFEWYICVVSTN